MKNYDDRSEKQQKRIVAKAMKWLEHVPPENRSAAFQFACNTLAAGEKLPPAAKPLPTELKAAEKRPLPTIDAKELEYARFQLAGLSGSAQRAVEGAIQQQLADDGSPFARSTSIARAVTRDSVLVDLLKRPGFLEEIQSAAQGNKDKKPPER